MVSSSTGAEDPPPAAFQLPRRPILEASSRHRSLPSAMNPRDLPSSLGAVTIGPGAGLLLISYQSNISRETSFLSTLLNGDRPHPDGAMRAKKRRLHPWPCAAARTQPLCHEYLRPSGTYNCDLETAVAHAVPRMFHVKHSFDPHDSVHLRSLAGCSGMHLMQFRRGCHLS